MASRRGCCSLLVFSFVIFQFAIAPPPRAHGAKRAVPENAVADTDRDHAKQRAAWFYRGRIVRGLPSAELRRRAYQTKLALRMQNARALAVKANGQPSFSTGSWTPLGPAPLASDASGNGTQDYRQVAGRATAVAIDPADSTGNTVYIGGAQAGVWKSTNAASATATGVNWAPLTDGQATLSIGAIAIQPGNSDPTKSVVLAATGEADNSSDSYFGLGILRSANGGASWSLISTANSGALSFSGLGGTRMAFSTASGQTSTVVAAMATSSEGLVDGAVTSGTTRGLYTSLDAGQSWTYDAISDPGGATDATSATSVVYNSGAALFIASIRYHGFYSSPDGSHWTRLAAQPGGSVLSTNACPPQSTSNGYACPIYRGEISAVPGRNEMYAWYVSLSSAGGPVDGGIWKSLNGGASWTAMSGTGITNCGDVVGCGVEQGAYNLELLAVPDGAATDVYAGAVNLYKCTITSANPTCAALPFMNLTHAYGCDPIAAPAHVHPDQHALAYAIPASGSDSGNALMYFANDGGVYRALDAYSGLNTGACSGANQFDDLNQNLGSMTQFVSFSQHPTDAKTVLGGAQGNGSPATNQATTSLSWINVLGGDGGYNAIDPQATSNWYASNPDVPPGGLGVQLCQNGVSCNQGEFNFVVTSETLGGDDGGFYFPYILDQHSSTAMLVGTCRVWRGPRTGGTFTALSPNFDTLGSATCSGSEVNQVRALAVAGTPDSDGSSIIYATTSGLGPLDGPLESPTGGRVWVTTDASTGPGAFVDVTDNGPQGSINPNQFPISGVATDLSDATGHTAYVTVMGFTGGPGHVWKTTNAGASWTDFTGNLPDSPVNVIVFYLASAQIFVATDVGVFASSTATPNWTELGPLPGSGQSGFLPNVAVTALGIFASGGNQLLRASTYGRGMWQFNLVITPDYAVSLSNSPQTVFAGQTAAFSGTASAFNGYASSISLSCASGSTAPPSTCAASPFTLTPTNNTSFTLTAGGAPGDYSFNLQATGSDASHITHTVPVTLHLVAFGLTTPSPASVTTGKGTTSPPVSFQATAAGSFAQSVTVTCSTEIPNATCNLTPAATVNPTASAPVNMTASVTVPAGTNAGAYTVTLQATTTGSTYRQSITFTLNVTSNSDFVLSEPGAFPEINAGSSGSTGTISITAQDGFSGTVALSCPATYGAGSCSISPASVSSYPATATLTINGTSFTPGAYSVSITGTSGSTVHLLAIPFNVGDYTLSGTQSVAGVPGRQASATFTMSSSFSYNGRINATCDASGLSGAMCSVSPANPITVSSGGPATITASINVPNNAVPGTYTIKINTQDTSGEPSHSVSFSLNLAQDFELISSTSSQTMTAGQTSGAYNLIVQPVGSAFTSAVTLACTSGLPVGAQCLFSPSTPVMPGNSAVDVVMNISTLATGSSLRGPVGRPAIWLFTAMLLPGMLLLPWNAGRRKMQRMRAVMLLLAQLLLTMPLFSCAGASTGGNGTTPPTNPATYHVTVSGSSPGTPANAGHSVVVILVVD